MSRFSFFRWGKSKSDADRSSGDSGRFVADSVDRKKVPEQNSSSDPHLPEKKRARRRLVGSVTLVLAAIIVLPMIFESKPKQATPDLLIDIPSRDKSLQTAANSQAVTSSADVAGAADAPASSGQSPADGIAPVSRPEQDAGQAATPAQTAVSVKDDTVSPVQEKPSAVQDIRFGNGILVPMPEQTDDFLVCHGNTSFRFWALHPIRQNGDRSGHTILQKKRNICEKPPDTA